MASAGMDTSRAASACVHAFVAEHSDLYKEQKDGDAAATVEGCFPPESTMPRERCVACLAALASLYNEVKATPAANHGNPRVMRVRDNPLFESLRGLDTLEGLTDVRTVTDYILLPKLLVEALELEAAVVKARTQYFAARATYDVATATTPIPRLVDFLLRQDHEKLSEMLEATLAACKGRVEQLGPGTAYRTHYYKKGALTFDLQPHVLEAKMANEHRALVDGMTGESLSEYGYEPGEWRSQAYATGCLLAGQPVPFSALPSFEDDEEAEYFDESAPPIRKVHLMALLVGAGAEVLSEFQELGFNFATKPDTLVIPLAAQSGSRETLSWLHAQDPASFMACGQEVFRACVKSGRFATARWLLEEFKFPMERPEQGSPNGCWGLCTPAAELNDLETVKWLHLELGYHLTPQVATHACRHGNREMLEFCLERRGPRFKFDLSDAIRAALEGGHWGLAFWLLEGEGKAKKLEGGRFLKSACIGFKGDVEVLEILMAIKNSTAETWYSLDPGSLIKVAARHGYIGALEWTFTRLRAEGELRTGKPLDPHNAEFDLLRGIAGAIEGNRADSARWLLERAKSDGVLTGRFWTSRKMHELTDDSPLPSIELLEVLLPCLDTKIFGSFYEQAVLTGNIDTLQWLGKHGPKIRPRPGFRLLSMLLRATGHAGEQAIPLIRCLREHCGLDIMAVEMMANRWRDKEVDSYYREADGGDMDSDYDHEYEEEYFCREDRDTYVTHKKATFSMMAACSGDIARVQFVRRELRLPIGPGTIYEAGKHGHLPLCRWLQKLLEPTCPWPRGDAQYMRWHGSDETAAWAQELDEKDEECCSSDT